MCAENIQDLRDKIKTFVYFDVETTGRMKAGDQVSPKITEFSLIAVKSDDLPGNIPPSYTYIDLVSVLEIHRQIVDFKKNLNEYEIFGGRDSNNADKFSQELSSIKPRIMPKESLRKEN